MTSKGPGKPAPSNSGTKMEKNVLRLNLSFAAASRSEEARGFSEALF